jgi:hypothetical protein
VEGGEFASAMAPTVAKMVLVASLAAEDLQADLQAEVPQLHR